MLSVKDKTVWRQWVLIHQKLYMGDNLAAVEMKDYLKNLGDTLLDSFGYEDDDHVRIEYDVPTLHLDVDTAIPLGLIINELVTNSLKYAFPKNGPNTEGGIITLSLGLNETKQLCLKVADNGIGKATAESMKNSTAFGTNLIQILSKKLKGKPEILQQERGYGTLIQFEEYKIVAV